MTPDMEREVRAIIIDVLKRELMSRYIPKASILPAKISPIRQDGSLPANGDPLMFDAATGLVTF